MDEWGFYTQPAVVEVYVGDKPTVIVHQNDTSIEALVVYNNPDVPYDVQLWSHDRRARGDATFAYQAFVFDISPRAGSIEGGTKVTVSGSGFATTHTFYSEETLTGMGSSLTSHTVHFGGTTCTVTAVRANEILCTTQPKSAATLADDATIETYVEVTWNSEPVHFACGRRDCEPPGCTMEYDTRACHFAFSHASTRGCARGSHSGSSMNGIVASGDTLTFELVDACAEGALIANATCMKPASQWPMTSTGRRPNHTRALRHSTTVLSVTLSSGDVRVCLARCLGQEARVRTRRHLAAGRCGQRDRACG